MAKNKKHFANANNCKNFKDFYFLFIRAYRRYIDRYHSLKNNTFLLFTNENGKKLIELEKKVQERFNKPFFTNLFRAVSTDEFIDNYLSKEDQALFYSSDEAKNELYKKKQNYSATSQTPKNAADLERKYVELFGTSVLPLPTPEEQAKNRFPFIERKVVKKIEELNNDLKNLKNLIRDIDKNAYELYLNTLQQHKIITNIENQIKELNLIIDEQNENKKNIQVIKPISGIVKTSSLATSKLTKEEIKRNKLKDKLVKEMKKNLTLQHKLNKELKSDTPSIEATKKLIELNERIFVHSLYDVNQPTFLNYKEFFDFFIQENEDTDDIACAYTYYDDMTKVFGLLVEIILNNKKDGGILAFTEDNIEDTLIGEIKTKECLYHACVFVLVFISNVWLNWIDSYGYYNKSCFAHLTKCQEYFLTIITPNLQDDNFRKKYNNYYNLLFDFELEEELNKLKP